jgi:ribosomal-protein-alanine N-acetyltransferase
MIRDFTPDDIVFIEQIGKVINDNYEFKINPFTKCLVYEQDKKVVGFIMYSIIYEKAEIIDIAVLDGYQRQNVGSQLLSYVLQECHNHNCENVTLEVRMNNQRAIAFYKKHGFREISTRKSYYHDGEDALVMIKMVI